MITKIQVVENSDRFHVSKDGMPVYTFLFGNGITKSFALMNANAEAYKLCVKLSNEGFTLKLLKHETKI